MSEGLLTWMNPKNDLMIGWEVGRQRVDEPQYEIDLLYQRYFTMNFQAFAGYRLTNDADARDRGLIGFNYRLPLMMWANVSLDTEGDARLTLAKRFQLTPASACGERVFTTPPLSGNGPLARTTHSLDPPRSAFPNTATTA
jgi:hypothetical protein